MRTEELEAMAVKVLGWVLGLGSMATLMALMAAINTIH